MIACLGLASFSGCWSFDEALALCLDGGGGCSGGAVVFTDSGVTRFDSGTVDAGVVDAGRTDAGGADSGLLSDAGTGGAMTDAGAGADAGLFSTLSEVCVPPGHTLCWEAPLSGRLDFRAAAWDGTSLWLAGELSQVVRWKDGHFTNWPELDDPGKALTAVLIAPDGGVFMLGDVSRTLTWSGEWQANSEAVEPGLNFGAAWTDNATRVIAGFDCGAPGSIIIQHDAWDRRWAKNSVRANVCAVPMQLAGDARDLWLLASTRVLHRGLDGGWGALDAGTTSWTAAASVSTSDVWFGGSDGTLAHVVDGGWSLIKPASATVTAIAPAFDGPLFATSDAALYHFSGSTWSPLATLPFSPSALVPDGLSRQFVVGLLGGVAIRDALGVRPLDGRIEAEVRAMARDTQGDGAVYAVGLAGTVLARGAQGWRPAVRAADPSVTLTSIVFESAGVARIGAFNGTVFALTGGQADLLTGERVVLSGSRLTDDVLGLVMLNGRMVAVGDRGLVAFRNAALNRFDVVRAPAVSLPPLTAIAVVGADAIAVGKRGAMVLIHDDAGTEVLDSGVTTDLTGVVGLGSGDYLVSTGLTLRHYVDGGVIATAAFANPPSGVATAVGGLSATSADDVWSFTASGDVFHVVTGQTSSWLVHEGPGSTTSVNTALLTGPDVFFGGDSAILHVTR